MAFYHSFYLMVELLFNCNASMKNLRCVVISFLKNNWCTLYSLSPYAYLHSQHNIGKLTIFSFEILPFVDHTVTVHTVHSLVHAGFLYIPYNRLILNRTLSKSKTIQMIRGYHIYNKIWIATLGKFFVLQMRLK